MRILKEGTVTSPLHRIQSRVRQSEGRRQRVRPFDQVFRSQERCETRSLEEKKLLSARGRPKMTTRSGRGAGVKDCVTTVLRL